MNQRTARASFFDASALVRVFTDEPGSEVVRPYFRAEPTKYTTPFCFYETLNVLKTKWKYRGELKIEEYLDASFRLAAWYGSSNLDGKDLNFTDSSTFVKAKGLASSAGLDLSDAFQILSVQQGYFAPMVRDSQTVFVTADKPLAVAARAEGLRVWSVLEEPPP